MKKFFDRIGFLIEERRLIRRVFFVLMTSGCGWILYITGLRLMENKLPINAAEASVIIAVIGAGGLMTKLYNIDRGKDEE